MKTFVFCVLIFCSFPNLAHAEKAKKSSPLKPEVSCTKKSDQLYEALAKWSKKDKFLIAVAKAYEAKFNGWKCEPFISWQVEKQKTVLKAKAISTCSGPEQHINVIAQGEVQNNMGTEGCMVDVTELREVLGD